MSEHSAEKDVPCTHPWWSEEGDGHGHNSWRCTTCGHSQWIAPWVLGTPIPPGVCGQGHNDRHECCTCCGWGTADGIACCGTRPMPPGEGDADAAE